MEEKAGRCDDEVRLVGSFHRTAPVRQVVFCRVATPNTVAGLLSWNVVAGCLTSLLLDGPSTVCCAMTRLSALGKRGWKSDRRPSSIANKSEGSGAELAKCRRWR